MEGKVEGFLHTFLLVMLSLMFYNILVKGFTPTSVQSWIGI